MIQTLVSINPINMYATALLGFITLVTGILGFIGLGFGTIPNSRIAFVILLLITIVCFFWERRAKNKRYYD